MVKYSDEWNKNTGFKKTKCLTLEKAENKATAENKKILVKKDSILTKHDLSKP